MPLKDKPLLICAQLRLLGEVFLNDRRDDLLCVHVESHLSIGRKNT